MKDIRPKRPPELDVLAVEVLDRLREFPEASCVVLGGHFALKHYVDYRTTHDIDAWFSQESTQRSQREVVDRLREIVGAVAAAHGYDFLERNNRSIRSFDMSDRGNTVFSVQIAERDIELSAPLSGPWHPVRIESLRDNIGSKMSAVVNRGAPRDFTDIFAVVAAQEIITVDEAWQIWQEKNPEIGLIEGKAQALRHLEDIALRRPMNAVPEPNRAMVMKVRDWVRGEFTRDPEREKVQEVERRGLDLEP